MLMTLAIKKWLSNQRARLPLRKDSPLRVLQLLLTPRLNLQTPTGQFPLRQPPRSHPV